MQANALTIVHKYLRHRLFEACRAFAAAGPGDVDALNVQLAETIELLHAHAGHEEAQLEPRLREADLAKADQLLRDHRWLDAELDDIAVRTRALATQSNEARVTSLLALHLDWNRFVARYLLHLDDEERAMFVAIPDAIPAIGMFAGNVLERDPEGAEGFLRLLGALVSPSERNALDRGRASLSVRG